MGTPWMAAGQDRRRLAGAGGWLERSARRLPDSAALRHGAVSYTYGELYARVSRVAAALASRGLRPGDRVGVVQWNGADLLTTMLAGFHGGLCVVPVNARSMPHEARLILDDAAVSAVVYGPEYTDHVSSVAGAPLRVCTERGSGADVSLDELDRDGVAAAAVAVRPDDPAWLFYTSGTTGSPKGATLSHRNLAAMVSAYLTDVRATAVEHVVLHAAPLTHGSGLYALPAIARGAGQILTTSRSYDPDEVLRLVREYEVTDIAFLTPTMVAKLAEAADGRPGSESLAHVVYGGAPMYVDDLQAAMARFGPVFSQIYGQAEAPVTISTLSRAEHVRSLAGDSSLLASAGYAYGNSEVAIRSSEGEVVPSGEGEILTRGEAVMLGYWENEAATRAALADGWLRTGDLGRIDADGRVWLLDRSKDVIITGGSNVYPREVEDVISDHPAVRQVAVVGAPDRSWGERVVAVLVLHSDADRTRVDDEIIALCRSRLAGYKIPRQLDVRDALPTSSYGKVLKREIRSAYWAGHERRI